MSSQEETPTPTQFDNDKLKGFTEDREAVIDKTPDTAGRKINDENVKFSEPSSGEGIISRNLSIRIKNN